MDSIWIEPNGCVGAKKDMDKDILDLRLASGDVDSG
jgi:hypothetical protein